MLLPRWLRRSAAGRCDSRTEIFAPLLLSSALRKGEITVARTSNVFVRVEPEIKKQAEQVLEQLGIPMSNAVGMFLRQVVLQRGIPFEMKLPQAEPIGYKALTKEQFDSEIHKGMEDLKAGRVYSADAVEEEMRREFGV